MRLTRQAIARALWALCGVAGFSQASLAAQGPPPGEQRLGFQVVSAGEGCGQDQASVRTLTEVTALASALVDPRVLGDTPPGTVGVAVGVDFSRYFVVQVSMGTQPSAGARLEMVQASQHRGKQRLTLRMHWTPPDPGQLHAAVITQPCVFVRLPRGHYRSLRVLDTQGATVLQAPLPSATVAPLRAPK